MSSGQFERFLVTNEFGKKALWMYVITTGGRCGRLFDRSMTLGQIAAQLRDMADELDNKQGQEKS